MPMAVYGSVCGFMILSAFGLPLPEEVILVSSAFVAHMAMFPETPHPPGVELVNIHVLGIVAFIAVMGSDYLIYFLGRYYGPKLFEKQWFQKMIPFQRLEKVRSWMQRYGYWPVILFRFTPGIRFPGHLMCGAMELSTWKFLLVDSLAAGISVPTQIYFVGFFGKEILKYFTRFKLYLLSFLVLLFVIFLINKWRETRKPLRK